MRDPSSMVTEVGMDSLEGRQRQPCWPACAVHGGWPTRSFQVQLDDATVGDGCDAVLRPPPRVAAAGPGPPDQPRRAPLAAGSEGLIRRGNLSLRNCSGVQGGEPRKSPWLQLGSGAPACRRALGDAQSLPRLAGAPPRPPLCPACL